MSLVKDVMTPAPATIAADATLAEAARLMTASDVATLPVVYGDKLVAVVTDRDLVTRGIADGREADDPVLEVASSDPVTVAPDDDVGQAMELMAEARLRRLPVIEDGTVVGILARSDVDRHLAGERGRSPDGGSPHAAR